MDEVHVVQFPGNRRERQLHRLEAAAMRERMMQEAAAEARQHETDRLERLYRDSPDANG